MCTCASVTLFYKYFEAYVIVIIMTVRLTVQYNIHIDTRKISFAFHSNTHAAD